MAQPGNEAHSPTEGREKPNAVESWVFTIVFMVFSIKAAGEPSGAWAAPVFAFGAVAVAIVRLTGKEGLYRVVSIVARRARWQDR